MNYIICPKCNEQNPSNSSHCSNCWTSLRGIPSTGSKLEEEAYNKYINRQNKSGTIGETIGICIAMMLVFAFIGVLFVTLGWTDLMVRLGSKLLLWTSKNRMTKILNDRNYRYCIPKNDYILWCPG